MSDNIITITDFMDPNLDAYAKELKLETVLTKMSKFTI